MPMDLTAYRFAKAPHLPVTPIRALVTERRGITGGVAPRVGRYLNSPGIRVRLRVRLTVSVPKETYPCRRRDRQARTDRFP
jgi:plasmid maintenance system antidote protein VapI